MGPVVVQSSQSVTGSAASLGSLAPKEEEKGDGVVTPARKTKKARALAKDGSETSGGGATTPGTSVSVVAKEQAKAEGEGVDKGSSSRSTVKRQSGDKNASQSSRDDGHDEEDVLLPEARPAFERNEMAEGKSTIRDNAVHVYGLDFLKTEHMNEIFSQFEHKYIEWINDSSANIVFRSARVAKKALESLSYPKGNDAPWRRTPDILVNDDCPPVFLQMRLATTLDTKKGKRGVPAVQQEDSRQIQPRERGRGNGGSPWKPYRDGISTELLEQAAAIGKRPAEALSEEEIAKRQKREHRFAMPAPVVRLTPACEMREKLVPIELQQGSVIAVASAADRTAVVDAVNGNAPTVNADNAATEVFVASVAIDAS
eukprot:TRINITY_DN48338_c0_g1_i1.p1 TRINITY_DN48338_c0_g1~~TRINITY_DN48338_c0_g1_i1.p1  ORF type:complete len:371 (-),score=56.79 TRINITY_DN48338_c0_g1_i1:342-1454(-)